MEILCDQCGHLYSRDTVINGEVIEEYKNVYGTTCPNCGFSIRPIRKPQFIQDWEEAREVLRMQALERIRTKILENTDGDKRDTTTN